MNNYTILTKRGVLDIEDCENFNELIEAHNEEQDHILSELGYKNLWSETYIIHDLEDDTFTLDSISEALDCMAVKEGVDLVRFDNGKIGFVAYYGRHISGFEIIGTTLRDLMASAKYGNIRLCDERTMEDVDLNDSMDDVVSLIEEDAFSSSAYIEIRKAVQL